MNLLLWPEDHSAFSTQSQSVLLFCYRNETELSVLSLLVSVLRSPPPALKLNKHRFDVTKGSGTSYGELSADITMSYKPIAPAPTGSNHTPPGLYPLFLMVSEM